MPRGRTGRTSRARKAFLEKLAECCNVSEAARVAGISRRSAYDWRNDDPSLAADWDAAEQEAIDRLEQTAWTRATNDNSDRMLEILLKAHRPEKYVERIRAEHTGRNGGPLAVRFDLTGLTDEELDQLERIRSRIAVAGGDQGGESAAGG